MTSNNRPTLYVHIGMGKTGSTAIQKHFRANSDLLLDHGVLYPNSYMAYGYVHYHLNAVFSFLPGEPKEIDRAIFDREVAASGAHSIIISNEFFTTLGRANGDEFNEYFSGYDIKIVVFIRHHVDWFVSMYGQSLSNQEPIWSPGFKNYCEFQLEFNPQPWLYSELLAEYGSVCGVENLIVVPYDPPIFTNGCVAHHFLNGIGVLTPELAEQLPTSKKENTGLDPRLYAMIERALRDDSLTTEQRDLARKDLVETAIFGSDASPDIVDEMRAFALPFFADHIAEYPQICEKYLKNYPDSVFMRPYRSDIV